MKKLRLLTLLLTVLLNISASWAVKYVITFQNYDGTVLQTGQVEEGVTPSYTGVTPPKPATTQFTYTFDTWTPALYPVSKDEVYTAHFTETLNEYAVTFKNWDGTTLQSVSVPYGTTPSAATYTNPTPTHLEDEQYVYTFNGWAPAFTVVHGPQNYTAQYSTVTKKYTITFENENHAVLQSEAIAYGTTPTYTGATPTKDDDLYYTYTFKGWDATLQPVTGAHTYTATYNATPILHDITFLDYDGTPLQVKHLQYGAYPTFDGTPERPEDDEFFYTFSGWSPSLSMVTGPKVYTATYSQDYIEYTVTFRYQGTSSPKCNNTYHWQETPVFDCAPAAHVDGSGNPIKNPTVSTTYTFTGWKRGSTPVDLSSELVEGDVTYTAQFSSSPRQYTITFKNIDGSTIQSSAVDYGSMPSVPTATYSDAQYEYTFTSWDYTPTTVTGDFTYTAQYSTTTRKYTITFENEDHTVLQQTEVDYGTFPAYTGATPTKTPSTTKVYTFSTWMPLILNVTGDATYTATYTFDTRYYTIRFLNYDDSELASYSFEYGETPSYAGTPTKPAGGGYSYIFDGWDPAIANVTTDQDYKATFIATPLTYTITYKNYNGTTLQTGLVPFNTMPSYIGATPDKPATAEYTYIFDHWDPAETLVSGNQIYTAQFSQTPNPYNLTWVTDGNALTGSYTHGSTPYGTLIVTPNTPTKTGYTFAGWSPAVAATMPAEATTYTATWTANTYKVHFDGNNKTDGTMADQNFTYDEAAKALTTNTYQRKYNVTYDYNGGTGTPASDIATYAFAGWLWNSTNYTDGQSVSNLSATNGDVLNFVAQWTGGTVTLPTPTRVGYTFAGWYNGATNVGGAGDTYTATAVVTLQAHWTPITYKVHFDGNNATSGTMADQNFTYDEAAKALTTNAYQRKYTITYDYNSGTGTPATEVATYTFSHWLWNATNYTDGQSVSNLTTTNNDVLDFVAQWTGGTVTLPTPTREGYTFVGWFNGASNVGGAGDTYTATAAVTLQAHWNINSYTITWSTDGDPLTGTYTNGPTPFGTPITKPATPTKTGYNFAVWSPDVPSTVPASDKNFIATWTANTYKIHFDGNGASSGTMADETFTYDAAAKPLTTNTYQRNFTVTYDYDGGTGTPASEVAQYNFTGWLWNATTYPDGQSVQNLSSTNNDVLNFVAQWTAGTVTLPTATRVGYTFQGWYNGASLIGLAGATYSPTAAITLKAKWEALTNINYKVEYYKQLLDGTYATTADEFVLKADGTADQSKTITPEKAYTGFTTPATQTVTIAADGSTVVKFQYVRQSFTLTWDKGTTDVTAVLTGGSAAGSYKFEAPITAPTATRTGYDFTGWLPAVSPTMPAANTTYVAQWSVQSYNVTWDVNGGNPLTGTYTHGSVTFGTTIVSPADPTRTGYTFAGWSPAVPATVPDADLTFVAQWTPIKYAIVFLDGDGNTKQSTTVDYDDTPVYSGTTPTKTATAEYTYTWNNGWSPAIAPVTGAQTYTATFDQTPNSYTLTWDVNGGNPLTGTYTSGTVAYGSVVTAPADPIRTGYVFSGWSPAVSATMPAANTTYTAQWTPVKSLITFLDGDGNTKQSTMEDYDTTPVYSGTTPTKTATAQYTYVWNNGWTPAIAPVTGDQTYTATFDVDSVLYTLTWVTSGDALLGTYSAGSVKYNTPIIQPQTPTRAGYTFVAWTPAVADRMPASDVTYTATWNAATNTPYVVNHFCQNLDGTYPVVPTEVENFTGTTDANVTPAVKSYTGYVAPATQTVTIAGDGSTVVNYNYARKTDVAYTVNHYQQNLDGTYPSTPTNVDHLTGLNGASVTPAVQSYAGFTAPDLQTRTIAADGSMVVDYYYTRNKYQLTWVTDGNLLTGTYTSGLVLFGTTIVEPATPVKDGNTFAGWSPVVATTMPAADVTYTATWTPYAYTIVFDGNGATSGSMSNQAMTCNVPAALTANAYTRTGYTFAGWAESATGVAVYSDGQAVTNLATTDGATITLYATWSVYTTILTWDANGGILSGGTLSGPVMEGTPLVAPLATREGYTFVEWSPAVPATMPSTNFTSQAQWTVNGYLVHFDGNGATTGTMTDQNFTYGTAQNLTANTFTREGYNFVGWSATASGAVAYTDAQSVSNLTAVNGATVNLYAVWSPFTYTVVYDKNALDATGTMAPSTHNYDVPKPLTTNGFTRTGYTFAGWAESATGPVSFTDQEPVTNLVDLDGETVTLYAVWTLNKYMLTWNAAEGMLTGGTPAGLTNFGTALVAPTATRTGYTFTGWSPVVPATMPAADFASTATWLPITYQIAYDANGGTGTMSNTVHTYGVPQNLSANIFTRADYVFVGWAASSTGSVIYSNNDVVLNLSSTQDQVITLYAVWAQNAYTIFYHANAVDATGATAPSTHQIDVPKPLTLNGFSRTGYNFKGWATTADGAKVYDNAQTVVNLATVAGYTFNLYAVWEAQSVMYMVNHHWMDLNGVTYTLHESQPLYANSGSVVTPPTLVYAGFTAPATQTITVAGDGTTEVDYYYTRNQYDLNWNLNGGTFEIGAYTLPGPHFFGENVMDPNVTKVGYVFDSWLPALEPAMPAHDVTYVAQWIGDPNTSYTVNHYQQNILDNLYTLFETENLIGTTDASVTPAVKTYTGFVAPAVQTVTVAADGSTVVNYYYDRTTYTVIFKDGDDNTIQSSDFKYGAMPVYTGTTPTKTPTIEYTYVWTGAWTPAITVVDAAATYTATFTNAVIPYTITFENYDHTVLQATDFDYGTTPVYSGAIPTKPDDPLKYTYTFDTWTPAITPVSGTATYTATYSVDSIEHVLTWVTAGDALLGTYSAGNIKYNTPIVQPQTPTRAGYTFLAWTPAVAERMPDTDVTYTATWTTNTNTEYTVNHFCQKLDGSYPTTPTESETLTGTTDETVTPAVKTYPGFTSPATQTITITGDGLAVVNYLYTRNTNTPYTVNHYKQNLDGTYPATPTETETLYGVTGAEATPAVKSYAGFTAPITQTRTILVDGSRVFDYQYLRNKYNITWVTDGDPLVAGYTTGSVYFETPIVEPATPTKDGYNFAAWIPAVATTMPAADVTYAATWAPFTYTVQYDGNGADGGATAASTHHINALEPLTLNGFTRTGYTFAGWATSATGTLVYADGQSVTNLATTDGAVVTLYAVWSDVTTILTWDANGGVLYGGTPSGPVAEGTVLVAPTATRDGYQFLDWSPAVPATMPATNQTFTAQWTANTYTIHFDGNGAAGSMTDQSMTFDVADNLTANTFSRLGYTFAGWATASDGAVAYTDAALVNNLTTVNGDVVTLYAVWTPFSYTVLYDGNGADGGSTASTVHHFDMVESLAINGFTRGGYTFMGWATETTGPVVYANGQPVTNLTNVDGATITLYAVWSMTQYMLTWNANAEDVTLTGGTPAGPTAYGTALTAPTATRTGYTFTAWSPVVPATMPASDFAAKAIWSPITYQVAYDANGGAGTMANSTFTYGVEGNLSANIFTMADKVFVGWATVADGAVVYANNNVVLNLSATQGDVITLYAKWDVNAYTIVYNGNGLDVTGTTPASTHHFGMSEPLTVNGFTRTGYTFNGWATTADGLPAYTDGQNVQDLSTTAGNTVNLYATWLATDVTYTVHHYWMNLDGLTFTLHDTQTTSALSGAVVTPAVNTYAGFVAPATQTVVVAGNSSTVVDYYYTRLTYDLNWDFNGGSIDAGAYTIAGQHCYGEPITAPQVVYPGYDFAGWAPAAPALMPDSDVTYTATWTPSVNTVYTVNHYQQNLGGTYPSVPTEIESLTGTTNTEVTPAVKTYAGFTAPATQTVTIAADGTTKVNYYYLRNAYTLTWVTDGDPLIGSYLYGLVMFGTPIAQPATPTKTGYTFAAWTPAVAATMPAEDVTYTATWTPNTDIAYTVEYYRADLTGTYPVALMEVVNKNDGTADAVMTIIPEKNYTGFVTPAPQSDTIKADGSTIIKFYYERQTPILTWDALGGTIDTSSPFTPAGPVLYETPITAPVGATLAGYDFAAWIGVPPTMPDTNITCIASYTPRTDTKYTVYHYLMNENGVGYTLDSTQILTGTTGATVTPDTLVYEGFISPARQTDTIAADGSTVFTYNYERVTHTLTWVYTGGTPDSTIAYTAAGTQYYGIAITAPVVAQVGYDFAGWTPAVPALMPDSDVTYTATWTPRTDTKYTVQHLLMNTDGVGYLLDSTQIFTGTTGDTITPDTLIYTGFISPARQSDTIKADGSTLIQYYYQRIQYNITFNNWNDTVLEVVPTYYGALPVATVVPTKDSTIQFVYVFTGWDPALAITTADASYKAVFTEELRKYPVTFYNYDSITVVLDTMVTYGNMPSCSIIPTRDADAEYRYVFREWSPAIVPISDDAKYYAVYDSLVVWYNVQFLNWDGTSVFDTIVHYRDTAHCYDIPTRNPDAQYTYTFNSWTPLPDTTTIVCDTIFRAVYDSILNDYVIRFINDSDTLQVDTLYYGTVPVYTGSVPQRDSTAEFTFIFHDWSPVVDTVRGAQDYLAAYDSIRNKYLIRFVNWNDTLLQQDSVEYGVMPVYNEALYGIPRKDTTEHFNYQFSGWAPVIAPVVGPEKYVAQFDSLINPDECWCDSAPAVELYEWLLMLDVRALHNMGYKFTDADVYWFQTTGDNYEPADTLGTPMSERKDKLVGTGYYLTTDKPLTGTGAYYAEIVLPQPQAASQLCQDFMRTAPFLFSSSNLLLAPSLVAKHEPVRLYGLHEGEKATLQIFNAAGQLVTTYITEADRYEWTNSVTGTYLVHIMSESFNETFKYIVK